MNLDLRRKGDTGVVLTRDFAPLRNPRRPEFEDTMAPGPVGQRTADGGSRPDVWPEQRQRAESTGPARRSARAVQSYSRPAIRASSASNKAIPTASRG